MANVQKYNRAAVGGGGLTRHFERAKDEGGEYHRWGNQEIDPGRSHLNYNLAPEREQGQLGFIKERVSEVKCHNRADVNIMCSWLITAPRTVTGRKGELGELILNQDEQKRFFEEAYKFLCEKYGERNVVSAYVHLDETTPHMHFAFVPVVVDRKKGHEKVSAKEALGWAEKGLHKFHREFDAYMTAVFGRDIGVLNEATKDGNKEVLELKRETAIAKAKAELEAELKSEKRAIEGKIALEKIINKLEDGMREKKGIFGSEKKRGGVVIEVDDMTMEQVKTVLNAARDRDYMRSREKRAQERVGNYEDKMLEAYGAANTAYMERNTAIDDRDRALESAEQREAAAKKAQEQAAKKQAQADALYRQQIDLNRLYENAVSAGEIYKAGFENELERAASLAKGIELLEGELDEAYKSVGAMAKADGSLLWDDSLKIKNITPQQKRLLLAKRDYAAKIARDAGFEGVAEDIEKHYGVMEDIQRCVDERMPKRERGRGDWDYGPGL